MSENFKFPNGGFDVLVLRKQDILDCIDKNIIDKDVALDIVRQCEVDATNFLLEGRWTGIPYIGSIRIPQARLIRETQEYDELIKQARETYSPQRYAIFRKHLSADIHKQVKKDRLYNYELSQCVTKNRKLFMKLCETRGELLARIQIYMLQRMSTPDITDIYHAGRFDY